MVAASRWPLVGVGNSACQRPFPAKNHCSVSMLIRGSDLGRSIRATWPTASRPIRHHRRTGTQVTGLTGGSELKALTVGTAGQ